MRFQSESEIVDFVRRFEDCSLDIDNFRHAGHVAVLAWYLLDNEEPAALKVFRWNLIRYAESLNAAENYHETVTVFWVKIVAAFLRHIRGDRLSRVNAAAQRFADKSLIDCHYSKELLDSPAARTTWIEPDIIPIT